MEDNFQNEHLYRCKLVISGLLSSDGHLLDIKVDDFKFLQWRNQGEIIIGNSA